MDGDDFYDVYVPENRDYLLSDPETDEPASEPEPGALEESEEEAAEEAATEPEAPEEEGGETETPEEAPPTEEPGDGSETMKDLISAIGDLNETITGAVTQEPEELPVEGDGSGAGGGPSGEVFAEEPASVDLMPVVQVLERTNELLEQQSEVLATQHNDLLQLQANVDFVFLAVAALIGVVLGVVVGRVFHDLWRA